MSKDQGDTTVRLVDAGTGGVAASYEYDPFGKVIAQSGSYADQNSWRFSTKTADKETAWLYYGSRFYNIEIGRWVSRDPIGEIGGVNIYSFVLNNPIAVIDPLGMSPDIPGIFLGALKVTGSLATIGGTIAVTAGSGGSVAPVSAFIIVWSFKTAVDGVREIVAATKGEGPPEPLITNIITHTYESIQGHPLDPQGLRIVKTIEITIDIGTACYSVHGSLKLARETRALARITPTGVPLQIGHGYEITTARADWFMQAIRLNDAKVLTTFTGATIKTTTGSFELINTWEPEPSPTPLP